jgi:hypothetical protein
MLQQLPHVLINGSHFRVPYRQAHRFTGDCAEDHPERENAWLHV